MKLSEAYSILEIPETSTSEEAKKQYRKLTKLYHPDINKDTNAESKFKKINEAYQVISTGKSSDRETVPWPGGSPFNPFGDNPFGRQRIYNNQPVNIKTTISFTEAVLGCEKDIKFNRKSKCTNCNGNGEIRTHNGCTACNGRGQVTNQRGGMIIVQACSECHGRIQKNNCTPCNSKGVIETEMSVRVNVPGGIFDNNILNLRGLGDFTGSFGPIEQYADAHLHVHVTSEHDLSLDGDDVVFVLQLSLQEALQGCKKIVKTINGYQDVEVLPKSRNKDEVIIPHLGVNRIGSQRVILDVKYPEDVSRIIETLNSSFNDKVN